MRKVSVILGTRPEAIKLCPVIQALRAHGCAEVHVCATGQHRELLSQVLELFEVEPDVNLRLMLDNQSMAQFTSRAIAAVDAYLAEHSPDLVMVQGDTMTVLSAALSASFRRIPVAHVEAGLRTGNKDAPFPEELNRVLTTHLADYHFSPTGQARANLLREGVPEDRIFVTGNTSIDALHWVLQRKAGEPAVIPGLPMELMQPGSLTQVVLVTAHRRENIGAGLNSLCQALAALAERFPKVAFVVPLHPNPNVRAQIHERLGGRSGIFLIEPLDYLSFVRLMHRAAVILTDSGGIQEEAPSLAKPVLVLRERTERPEGLELGLARLVGTDPQRIIDEVARALDAPPNFSGAIPANPYGDGHASERIVKVLCALG